MGSKTGIAWCDGTWNPWQGYRRVSTGCKNCYMFREKLRYGQDPTVVVRSKHPTFNAPLRWAKNWEKGYRELKESLAPGSRIFVCSWSDFFHEDADPWRQEAWNIIQELSNYTFLIPTKRIERAEQCLPANWHDGYHNVWLGISAENQATFNTRMPILADIPAAIHWVSAEPLLGPIEIASLPVRIAAAVEWVVIGGESGPGCRPMDIGWAFDLAEECDMLEVPVFIKQLGGWPNTQHELSDMPEGLRIREFPSIE
jgi:protein gp37